jgi:SAM-dependent methyltransferase
MLNFDRIIRLAAQAAGQKLGSLQRSAQPFAKVISESKQQLAHLTTSTDARLNALANEQFESKNLITHLNTSLHSRLDKFENELLPTISDQIHELIALTFDLRARNESNRANWIEGVNEQYRSANREPFGTYLVRAERDFPQVYALWLERLDRIREAFLQTKVGNAAHAGDAYSRIFRCFVEIYAKGRVLDVGCGVLGRPYYLCSYPPDLLSGLDPLEPFTPADFELVQGLSEYLPWPDSSFSTVISATSLDHCLSLEGSIIEIERVLREDGVFLLWIGSNPGSPRYNPTSPDFVPADHFHLFHFDISWWEPILEAKFVIVDRIELKKNGYSHVMYSLAKKKLQR